MFVEKLEVTKRFQPYKIAITVEDEEDERLIDLAIEEAKEGLEATDNPNLYNIIHLLETGLTLEM